MQGHIKVYINCKKIINKVVFRQAMYVMSFIVCPLKIKVYVNVTAYDFSLSFSRGGGGRRERENGGESEEKGR